MTDEPTDNERDRAEEPTKAALELLRLGEVGREIPAARYSGRTFDLRPITEDLSRGFWVNGIEDVRKALRDGSLPDLEGADRMRVGAPVADPGAVLCIGQNYAAHAAESGSTPPKNPMLFLKHPNTLTGPYDSVRLPRGSTQFDWEVELAVVIGRRASYLPSPTEALAHIAGFTIANDLSERVWQHERGGSQFSKGKSAPGSNPLGPVVVPADEIDPQRLGIWSRVNGEQRQNGSTADMIFDVAHLVWDLSQYLTLEPGDIIETGTPEGVAMGGRYPFLQAGDRLEVGIDGIGAHRSTIEAASNT